jgi:hypothetical protein
MRLLRRLAATVTAIFLALLLARFVAVASFEWDDWAALVVQWAKGPLVLNLVNETGSSLPVVDVGISGWFCQSTCVAPGARETCRPRFRQQSPIFVNFGGPDEAFPNIIHAPRQPLPVVVTWRSHGSVDLIVTDAGVEVHSGLSEEFP